MEKSDIIKTIEEKIIKLEKDFFQIANEKEKQLYFQIDCLASEEMSLLEDINTVH
jgi:hypothetical protein